MSPIFVQRSLATNRGDVVLESWLGCQVFRRHQAAQHRWAPTCDL